MKKVEGSDTPPWVGAQVACIGWVPTADGHLSFSLIGKGTRPASFRYSRAFSEEGGGKLIRRRMVAAFQKRQNRDAPFVVRAFRPSATHHWLLTGKTLLAKYPTANPEKRDIFDDQGMLKGTILIIPYQSFFETDLTAQYCKQDIADILRANQAANPDEVENQLQERVNWMKSEGVETLRIRFALFRTGELHLWMEPEEIAKIADTEDGTENEQLQISTTPEMSKQESILRQAYYFVKDAAHCHTHHDDASDQLTPLVLKYSDELENGYDLSQSELQWQRETLWGLSRAIEELVRRGTRHTLRNALGLISFAESFQNTLAGYVRKTGTLNTFGQEKNFHDYDFKSLRESVKVSLDRQTWSLAGKAAMAGSVFAIGLSSVAATNVIANKDGNMWAGPVADMLYQCPPMFPSTTIVLLSLVFLIVYREADFLRTFFALENFFAKFVRSHVKWVLDRWAKKSRSKHLIAVTLTFAAFTAAIVAMGYGIYTAYGYLNFCGINELPHS